MARRIYAVYAYLIQLSFLKLYFTTVTTHVRMSLSSVHFQFSPKMAGFPDILNYFRHNRIFGTCKTPNFRAQRHGDKCFTSYNVSKLKALLEKQQTGIRVENSLDPHQVRRFVRV